MTVPVIVAPTSKPLNAIVSTHVMAPAPFGVVVVLDEEKEMFVSVAVNTCVAFSTLLPGSAPQPTTGTTDTSTMVPVVTAVPFNNVFIEEGCVREILSVPSRILVETHMIGPVVVVTIT